MRLSRRSLLVLPAATVLTACADKAAGPSPSPQRPSPSSSPSRPVPPSLPAVARFAPVPDEPLPKLKQAAADFVQALGTTDETTPPDEALLAAARLAVPALDLAAVRRVAAPLYDERTTTTEVVYPQFAGLAPLGPGAGKGAVMVVARHRALGPRGTVREVVRVHDVRLRVVAGTWRVTGLASVGGEPVDRPDGLDERAVAVLDSDRIELPDSSRWDVHAGRVDPVLLDLLLKASRVAPLSVTVLRTGHPANVFGTARQSDHTAGRAVDIWRVDGRPVVEQATDPASAGRRVQRGVFALPALRQLGSPPGSDLDGRRRRSFTDLVHADHLHLAATSSTPSSG